MHLALTGDIDVAQLVLVAFFLFFAGLVFYLRREDKREGYPLEDPETGREPLFGFPVPPPPKVFLLMHGGEYAAPSDNAPPPPDARPLFGGPGSPLEPVGDPMLAGVGPGAWSMRRDAPLLLVSGQPQMAPLRSDPAWSVVVGDMDPRGMTVVGADRAIAGTVIDLWADRSAKLLRYLEVETEGGRRVLLPIYYTDISRRRRRVLVRALLARQFGSVPTLANPDVVTAREEDRINAYYAGGLMYATPDRRESLL